MRLMQKTIATLLIICMMFSLVPPQTGMFDGVYENVFASGGTVGGGSHVTIGSAKKGAAGGAILWDPTIRVHLSRKPETRVDTTDERVKELEDIFSYKYAPFSVGEEALYDTLFFFPSTTWKYFEPWDNNIYAYYSNSPDKGMEHMSDADTNAMFVPIKTDTKPNTNFTNPFKEKVLAAKDAKIINSTQDLANYNWQNYLPGVQESYAILGYICKNQDNIEKRIREVTDANFCATTGFTPPPPDKLTNEQAFNVAVGYGGLLASLYVIADNHAKADCQLEYSKIAESYATALNDYFSNNNIQENPVTLLFDTCMVYTDKSTYNTTKYCVSPSIDLLEYILAVDNSFSIRESDAFIMEATAGAGGTTREMIMEMAWRSVEVHPFAETKGHMYSSSKASERKVLRLADRESIYSEWGHSLHNTAIGWAIQVFQLKGKQGCIWIAGGTPAWGNGGEGSYLDMYYMSQRAGIDGYVMVGNQVGDPAPSASYWVDDTLHKCPDTCEPTVPLTAPAKITVQLGKESSFLSFVENAAEDTPIRIESSVTRSEYINSLTSEPVEVKVGGYASEGGPADPDMAVLQNELDEPSISKVQLIEKMQNVITFNDNSILQHEPYERELNGSKTVLFKYDINLKIYIGEEFWEFKAENMVRKNNGVPLNTAIYLINPHKENDVFCDDIVITKPTSTTMTEVINPSENENLSFNTRMVRRYEYTSSVGKTMAADGVADVSDNSVASFAELKSNTPLQEEFEVLAGIPSSEEIYFSVGGSEYKVAVIMQYWMNEHSRDRTYTMHFEETLCEYNNKKEGKGDTWPGADTAGNNGMTKIPEATDPSSSDYTFDHDGNLEIVCTWTGDIPFNGTPWKTVGRCDFEGANSWDWSDYNTALANAQAWETALKGVTISWTAASDKETREYTLEPTHESDQHWSAGSSECPEGAREGSGKSCTHSTCGGHGSGSNKTPCTNHFCKGSDSSVVTETDGSFTITVKATIDAHMICGPCCGHELPDLYDTWRQGLVYDYAKISQIRLYLLDQGSVEGMKELVGSDRIIANIVSGNPTYFMNIAQMTEQNNPFYPQKGTASLTGDLQGSGMTFYGSTGKNGDGSDMYSGIQGNWNRWEAQSSRAGRLRYVLDPTQTDSPKFDYTIKGDGSSGSFTLDRNKVANPRQHDDVIYTIGTRSAVCDGMATTNNFNDKFTNPKSSDTNVIPMDITGHHESKEWALGCLYTNIQNTTDYSSYHELDSLAYTYDPKELKENDVNVPNYYEDYNHHIVRGDGADKSTYSDKADTKDTQTAEWKIFDAARRTRIIVDVISDFLILQTSGGDQSIFYFEKVSPATEAQEHFQKVKATQAEMFTENPLSVFNAYEGECAEICPSGENVNIKDGIIGFEIIGGYNGRYDVPSKKYKPYSIVTKKFLKFYDEGWSKYSATYREGNWTAVPGGNYSPHGNSEIITVFDKDPAGTISRPERQATSQATSLKIYQDNIQILPTSPNKFYQPSGAMLWYSQVAALFSPDTGAMDMEMPGNGLYVGAAKNVDLGHVQRGKYAESWKEYWGNSIGLEIGTNYYLTEDGLSDTDSINGVLVYTPVSVEDALVLPQGSLTIQSNSGRPNVVSRDQRVNAFDTPDMNEMVNKLKVCTLDPATCEYRYLDCKYLHETVLADFNFEPKYMGTEPDYSGTYPQNLKPTEKDNTFKQDGKYITTNLITGVQYELPAGYTITSGGGFGTGNYLSATGSTAWSIPFSDLGLSGASYNRLKISMDLKVNASNNVMLVGFKNIGFVIDGSGKGQYIIPDEKKTTMVGTSKSFGNTMKDVKLDLIVSFNNIIDCTAYVNGVEASVSAVKDYRTVWQDFVNDQGFSSRKQVTDMITLSASDLVNNPPADLGVADLGGVLNIGTWNNVNTTYNANYYIDNLSIVLMGGTTEHNSSCYSTNTIHTSSRIHVCDDKCYLDQDVYNCDGKLNADYQHGDNYANNSHTCTDSCKTGVTAGAKTDYYYRSHYDTQYITGYVVTLGSYSYIWPGSGNYVYRYSSQCGRDYNMPSSVIGSAVDSGYVTLDSTSYPGRSGHSTIVYKYKLVQPLTIVSGKIYVNKCTGTLNTHTHQGTAGLDYANGCYTVPTVHKHDNVVRVLTCGIPEGGTGQTTNYTTSGSHTVTLSAGKYKLEVWGAQGAGDYGGKGGYSTGTIVFNTPTTIYLGIGGRNATYSTTTATFNGGGAGRTAGGGATHIATAKGSTGALSELSSNTAAILLVAGGGGGGSGPNYTSGSSVGKGGAGGGANMDGVAGGDACGTPGGGGTTSAGGSAGSNCGAAGSFGKGGSSGICSSESGGGGGGGYYGGGGGGHDHANPAWDDSGGGGGSGYANTSKLTDISGTSGTWSGSGKVAITNLDHKHTDACYKTTTSSCPKTPAGTYVCTGELNTTTDLNTHIHNQSCLTDYKDLTPTNFFYTGDAQTYKVPYTDYYRVEVYGAGTNTVGYASGVVKLKAGSNVYVYVGGTDGYNNFASDVRLVKYSDIPGGLSEVEQEIYEKTNETSLASRLMTAGATKNSAKTFTVGDYVLTDTVTKGMGGSGTGRVVITPLNRLPMQNGQKTILNQILDGDIPEENAQKYLGDELANIIINKAQVFKTWSNFSWTNYQGFVKDSNLITFANGKIISRIASGVGGWEFHVPVNIEAKSLRQVRITLDNNTNTTSIGVGINGGQKEVITNVEAKKAGQVITIPVSDKWWNDNITSLYFDLYPGTPNETGTIAVSKIELIGHANLSASGSGYGYTTLKTINNFSTADTKGFTARNNATISYNGSNMRVTSTGNDPITDWNTVNTIATNAVKAIKIVFKNNSGKATAGQLFYGGTMGTENETNSFMWDVGATANTQTVWIDTVNHISYNETTGKFYSKGSGWSGNVTAMRFDWGTLSSGSTDVVSISFIGNGSASGTGSYKSTTVVDKAAGTTWTFGSGGNTLNATYGSGSVTLPAGKYKLEVWGAQGGSGNGGGTGGLGGYAVGEKTFNTATTVYVGVGQQPTSYTGGWNGGGAGCSDGGSGGGGATHIALSSKGTGGTQAPGSIAQGSFSASTPYCWYQTASGCTYEGYYAYSNNPNTYTYHCNGWVRKSEYDYGAAPGTLAGLANSTTDVLIVAGGGGGGGCNPGSAGGAGSTTGSYANGSFGTGGNANPSSGSSVDHGGGGGGGYTGGGGNQRCVGGGGGTNYIGGVTGGSTSNGQRSGHGYATITLLENTYKTAITQSKVTITASTPSTTVTTAQYKNPFENKTTAQQTIFQNIDKIPEYVDGDYNPIFICKFQGFNAHDCENCQVIRRIDCDEPHHKGIKYNPDGTPMKDNYGNDVCIEHYSGANKICWSACGKDSNHKNTITETTVKNPDGSTTTLQLADFLQLDEGFTIYFPNIGDFYGNGQLGLARVQLTRGYGYEDNMDTTRWTREKRVKFPFDVIYDPSPKSGQQMAIYPAGSWIELYVPDEYFNFYLLVENPELANAEVEFECEAINCATNAGLKVKPGISYTERIGTIYQEKLNYFLENYLQNWYDDILDGGYIRDTAEKNEDGSGNTNTNGTRAGLSDFGYMDFYESKQDNENKAFTEALEYIDTQVEKDFEGTDNDYIDPHHIDGGGSDEYDGINEKMKSRTSNDNKVRVNNAMRTNSLQHLHGAYKSFYLDVIGRIGNFAITDTEDFRFSNFFKVPVSTLDAGSDMTNPNNWLVEGLVQNVDDGVQNLYVGDMYDLRGNPANPNNRWLDTYGTQEWMAGQLTGAGRDVTKPNLVSQILTGEVNNIEVLKEEQLRYGYDIYTSLVTFGNYENGQIQVVPKYYALKVTDKNLEGVPNKYNVPKGTYLPIDIYINKDGVYQPVNVFDNAGNGDPNKGDLKMNDYVFNVDWTVEGDRRNYSLEEIARTNRVKEYFKTIVYDTTGLTQGEDFDLDSVPILDIVEYVTPEGTTNYLGTAQYILMDAKHRTFIGNSDSYDNNPNGDAIWDGCTYSSNFGVDKGAYVDGKNTDNTDRPIEEIHFERAVQRWHGKLGIPSSAVFVPHGEKVDGTTLEYIMGKNQEDWVIVCTAEMIAMGSTWNIYYSQPWFTSMTINGNSFDTCPPNDEDGPHYPGHRDNDDPSKPCDECIPPIIAVFGKTSVDDVEIIQIY